MTGKTFVGIFQREYDSEPEPVVGSYESVLKVMGKWWKRRGLSFDLSREDPFFVDPSLGYDTKVRIMRKKGRISWVSHGEGGAIIHITEVKVLP